MLRLSEAYLSTQGEGPRVGLPTVFVRFAGCNLRCPGWACDTQHAIDPAKYRNEWQRLSPLHVADKICMEVVEPSPHVAICFTGGEPFLQNQDDLLDLHGILRTRGFKKFEAFTNATLQIDDWIFDEFFLNVDYKLDGSGELVRRNDEDAKMHEQRIQNIQELSSGDSLKFVIKDRADFDQAVDIWEQVISQETSAEIYYGRVWQSELTDALLVKWVLELNLPWRHNVQLHNYIWPPHERAR